MNRMTEFTKSDLRYFVFKKISKEKCYNRESCELRKHNFKILFGKWRIWIKKGFYLQIMFNIN